MVEIFAKLGKVISSAGSERFASDMHALLAESIPLGITKITEWTFNEPAGKVVRVQSLGAFGAPRDDAPIALPAAPGERACAGHPLLNRILTACDRQLIHINPPARRGDGDGIDAVPLRGTGAGFQCHLVSCKANRRYVISLHRTSSHRDFSLQEMSFLKNFADTLLPLVEWHAAARRHGAHERAPCRDPAANASGLDALRREFESRLERAAVALSARESEVCLGLLAGKTLREMSGELGVKESTVETYIKRAAVKLGISGRHGLTRWMIDDCAPCASAA
ncbi:helix-turn-helix domain-containing protein [Burkholderia oklahomensis]|uniref:Bacterial regulatory s, luxR family protein n=1 Tax=Burkholderia oklahomensis TaxID=342113 RepID=A0AAI8B8D3_9BURK|nr:helix-turn-helix transcriptional regulator [Burkholderia oklahomensis]AIO67627.1 bacterial regulatory s, luxR family protein [Burkholderia oklahomensis]AOI44144.1 helix-turn-helix transcriptional regulator [Burkholderia oklahomensis EO147]KUY57426.1 helix-turn-helix transcriptional regulator [Burkholderia oklahomensis EO147]QPS36816.1 helix-turn-helix transcriptional regulator [Burkholderia oklahomensis]